MAEKNVKEVSVSARIEERLRDELQEIADRNERTFSHEVRRALRLHVLAETSVQELEEAS